MEEQGEEDERWGGGEGWGGDQRAGDTRSEEVEEERGGGEGSSERGEKIPDKRWGWKRAGHFIRRTSLRLRSRFKVTGAPCLKTLLRRTLCKVVAYIPVAFLRFLTSLPISDL